MRIQFYPNEKLEEALQKDAEVLGISVCTLVNDVLNKHYGLVASSSLTSGELRVIIFQELAEFVEHQDMDKEFDLNEGSKTYRTIDMVYEGKPSTIKAQIGKEFNNKYVGQREPFLHVQQVRLKNGKPKLTISNRAALYVVRKAKETR